MPVLNITALILRPGQLVNASAEYHGLDTETRTTCKCLDLDIMFLPVLVITALILRPGYHGLDIEVSPSGYHICTSAEYHSLDIEAWISWPWYWGLDIIFVPVLNITALILRPGYRVNTSAEYHSLDIEAWVSCKYQCWISQPWYWGLVELNSIIDYHRFYTICSPIMIYHWISYFMPGLDFHNMKMRLLCWDRQPYDMAAYLSKIISS